MGARVEGVAPSHKLSAVTFGQSSVLCLLLFGRFVSGAVWKGFQLTRRVPGRLIAGEGMSSKGSSRSRREGMNCRHESIEVVRSWENSEVDSSMVASCSS